MSGQNRDKPLGHKGYGSIGHLPGSRVGPADKTVHEGQAAICCIKARDKNDRIIVQEKVDGSNCSVARIGDEIVPLGRAGYTAISSPFEMHHMFHEWAAENADRFMRVLDDGERLVGEWMAQAHGTVYGSLSEPFIVFDIMRKHDRETYDVVLDRAGREFAVVNTVHVGGPLGIEAAVGLVGDGAYGAVGGAEGAVWRVERFVRGAWRVDFLAKYVKPEKVDGAYLPNISGADAVWNWRPLKSQP